MPTRIDWMRGLEGRGEEGRIEEEDWDGGKGEEEGNGRGMIDEERRRRRREGKEEKEEEERILGREGIEGRV